MTDLDDSGGTPPTSDPITRDLVKSRFTSARREVEVLIERSAMSPVIREKKDYFVAFFTAEGGLITGTNFPLGGNAIAPIISRFSRSTMRPGDVYGYNDPYGSAGGVSHVPDFVLVRPVFFEDEVVAFVQVFGHMWDVGGIAPGSVSPDAVDIFHEGFRCPPIKLGRDGKFDEETFRILLTNTRFPRVLRGDLRALAAACEVGNQRIVQTFDDFGSRVVGHVLDGIFEQGRQVVELGLQAIPDGQHTFVETIDPQGTGATPVQVRLTLEKTYGRVTVDTTDSDDQSRHPINFLMDPSVIKMMYGIYSMRVDSTVALNAGMLDGIADVRLRPGSILQPEYPAPLGMRGITWSHTTNAMLGTVAKATGGESPAASASYVVYYLRGFDRSSGEYVFLMDGLGAGYGAKPYADGLDVIYYLAQKNMPVEFLESRWPIRVLGYCLHCDSGGPGLYRGGVGVVRRIEVLKGGLTFSGRVSNAAFPPWGVNGGRPAAAGQIIRNPGTNVECELPPVCEGVALDAGEIIEVRTSGGGGYGDPYLRDPFKILSDYLGGFVSLQGAHSSYGVIIDPMSGRIDMNATKALRGH